MKYRLSDICHYVKGKVDVSELDNSTYISTENMLPDKGGVTEAASLPTTLQTQIYEKDDVLVSNIRPYFKKIWFADQNGGCSNDVLVFRANEGVEPGFLYYVLADDKFFDFSMATSKGTKMPRGDKKALMEYEVLDFNIDTQKKVASLLGDIDEKIRVNTEINDNLEQQAQALFNDFFINRNIIPETWKKGSLLDIADYLNGLAMQKFRPNQTETGIPILKIKELRQGQCDVNSELCSPNIQSKYIVLDGDVIFSWSGSLLVDFWCGGKCGLNQHLFKVTSSKYDKWFYYSWTKYYLNKFITLASSMATTMGHIKRGELANAEVLIPNEKDYNYIGSLLQPIYDLIISNRLENIFLSDLRDTLLPKFMSGEIDVSKIEL